MQHLCQRQVPETGLTRGGIGFEVNVPVFRIDKTRVDGKAFRVGSEGLRFGEETGSSVGIADAQLWNDESVDRLPAFLVCTYALLMLAALQAHGPTRTTEYLTPPKRQNKRRQRPSCVDLIQKLREEAHQNPVVEQEVGFPVNLTHIILRAT